MLKRLLTRSEEVTNDHLKSLTEEWGTHTFIKTRLADVFPIAGSGISGDDYRFALQSHFDFLVTDKDLWPLFAVEFDGDTHLSEDQHRRDSQKDRLCERFDLPILRINSRYLEPKYRGLDLLAWFIHCWFLSQSLADAQDQGFLPADEPIDPTMVVSLPGNPRTFPLWLSAAARAKIDALAKEYPEQDPIPSCTVVEDKQGNLRAIAWLRVDQQSGILVRTGMRSQRFSLVLSELLEDIAVIDLLTKLQAVRAGKERPLPIAEVDREIKDFTAYRTLFHVSAYGRDLHS